MLSFLRARLEENMDDDIRYLLVLSIGLKHGRPKCTMNSFSFNLVTLRQVSRRLGNAPYRSNKHIRLS